MQRSTPGHLAGLAALVVLVLASACSSESAGAGAEGGAADPSSGPARSDGPASAASRPSPGHTGDAEPAAVTSVPPPETTPGPSIPTDPNRQTFVLDGLPGDAAGGCVDVGDRADVRSGSIAAGSFVRARESYAEAAGSTGEAAVDLYVIPEHLPSRGVEITLRPVEGSGRATSVRVGALQSADVWRYYSVQLPVPGPGLYRLTARTSQDRGCFTVRFG